MGTIAPVQDSLHLTQMSEYQCYQWRRACGSLSPKQHKEVSGLSSHISVSSDYAEVTYRWGDFKHDPVAVLKTYFDLFSYETNWGTQQIAFRFDAGTVDSESLEKFSIEELITIHEENDQILLNTWYDENWVEPQYYYYDEYQETNWRIEAMTVIYRQILEGDYRGLFILWLKACELSPESETPHAVELPKGMAQLDDEHRVLADFIGVSDNLLKQAADRSHPLPKKKHRPQNELLSQLNQLSPERKEEYLQRLVNEDALVVQSKLKRELQKLSGRPVGNFAGEIVSYQELAENALREAELEALRIRKEKEKRRKDYLKELGDREDEIWDRVHDLVSQKKPKTYDEAVVLLRGLEDLWTTRGEVDHFLAGVKQVADEFPRLIGFRGRLENAGWLDPAKRYAVHESHMERWEKANPLEREIDFKTL